MLKDRRPPTLNVKSKKIVQDCEAVSDVINVGLENKIFSPAKYWKLLCQMIVDASYSVVALNV